MAYTEAQLDALKNSLLASGQPDRITAIKHRQFEDAIISELFDEQSRGNLFALLTELLAYDGTEKIFVIKNGVAKLLPSNLVGGGGSSEGAVIKLANIDLSSNALPVDADGIGTGTAGAILKGNQFRNTGLSTSLTQPDGGPFQDGAILTANQDSPTMLSHWDIYYIYV